jgi:hypothetical protein
MSVFNEPSKVIDSYPVFVIFGKQGMESGNQLHVCPICVAFCPLFYLFSLSHTSLQWGFTYIYRAGMQNEPSDLLYPFLVRSTMCSLAQSLFSLCLLWFLSCLGLLNCLGFVSVFLIAF